MRFPWLAFALLFFACSKINVSPLGSTDAVCWVLSDSGLKETGLGSLKTLNTPLSSWALALRPVRFLKIKGQPYLLVNQKGLIRLGKNPLMDYHTGFFASRTAGNNVSYGKYELLHLYGNSMFDNHPLSSLFLSLPDMQIVEIPKLGPDCLELWPFQGQLYALQMEGQGKQRNASYYKVSGSAEVTPLSAQAYYGSHDPQDLRLASPGLKNLLSVMPADPSMLFCEFLENGQVSGMFSQDHRVNDDPVDSTLVNVRRWDDETGLILSKGSLISSRSGIISRHTLPLLPPGFLYTDWLKDDKTLFVSWEERVGQNVGISGFLALPW